MQFDKYTILCWAAKKEREQGNTEKAAELLKRALASKGVNVEHLRDKNLASDPDKVDDI